MYENKASSKPVRVLEAFGEPIGIGGQESFVFGFLEKMSTDDLAIDCLTAYGCHNEYYRKLVSDKGGSVYALQLPFTPGKSRENIRKPLSEFLKEHPYDVIHIHSGSISALAVMSATADNAGVSKIIVHSHATGYKDSLKHKILRRIASFSMRRHVDIYCACSKEAAEWKFEGKYAEKAMIIKNSIDEERFRYRIETRERVRRKLGYSAEAFVIGHVGRFSPEKNHRFLLDVFETASRKDATCKLLLVGGGSEKQKIESIVRERGLEGKVNFTGPVTNPEDYLQAMDVFVLPSLYEGMPVTVVEAQCTGLPVLVSDNVTKDVKTSDKVVYIPLTESPDAWSKVVLAYKGIEREDGRKSIAEAGYSITRTARLLRELYIR